MGSCLFRLELLTDHEPRRRDGDSTWVAPVLPHPGPLPRGEGESSADFREYDDSSHRMAHGSWAAACSDGNCSRTMNRGRSQSLREEDTSALTPALSPRRGRIVASRRVSRWFQWTGGSWKGPRQRNRAQTRRFCRSNPSQRYLKFGPRMDTNGHEFKI
jgi:hypothetical protein